MNKVLAECGACGGTGLYSGFAEPKGTAVVCLQCKGTGCQEIRYTPFTVRKGREGIHWVQKSRGGLIAFGVGPVGRLISYQEFQRGKMP